jgi:4-hydroxy-tetrahydrodipicolinate synthase
VLNLRGSMVALVTPFRDGRLDEAAFRRHVRWQLDEGIDGLVPCGTTGEGATLGPDESQRAVAICVEETRAFAQAKGVAAAVVIAGCGTNATSSTIANVKRAREAGADAALVVTPYYNKPSQEGLYRHFEAVAREGGLPVVLYNVPTRTSVDLLPDTIARLARVPNVVGVKEASGNVVRVAEIREKAGDGLAILAGDDMFTLATLAMGGQGVISVVGNVAPGDLARLSDAFFAGDLAGARAVQQRFTPLVRAMFLESNPMPAKHALERMGRMSGELRPPLCPVTAETAAKIDAALAAYGIRT